ncbi:Rpn family recombination-promoting nuclease/putative transposase [Spirochaeta dissipatitropha]
MAQKKDHFIHKHGYGILFSNRTLLRQLFESFVDEEFARRIDFTHAEPLLEKSYISEHLRDFADDLLVRVHLKDQKDPAYLYLMIEFQSTPDRFMSLRLLNYITLFYLDYLADTKDVRMLPPVFPLVLYNGTGKWNAPTNIRDIIDPDNFCRQFTPDFQYLTIVENSYSEAQLLQIHNAVSTVFLLENTSDKDFEQLAGRLSDLLDNESAETIALLSKWIRHLFINKKVDMSVYNEITLIQNMQEAKSMLVETIEKVKKNWLEQGQEKGVEKKAVEDAQKMLEKKYPLSDIAEITGLSPERIAELEREIQEAL